MQDLGGSKKFKIWEGFPQTSQSHKTLAVIMNQETVEEKQIVEKVKTQTEQLWNTIQEAKKSNLIVQVGFDDNLIKPYLKVFKELY